MPTTDQVIQAIGAKLYTKTWEPEEMIYATVIFIHGLGEHINRYDSMFQEFARNGIKVRGFDQRGFGQTVRLNGVPGVSEGLQTTLRDIDLVSKSVQMPTIPHFVMGQSMGGGLALLYSYHYPEGKAGVISMSPAIKPGSSTKPNIVLETLLRTVLKSSLKSVVVPNELDARWLSRDNEQVKKFQNDPLNHGFTSVGLGSDMINEFEKLETEYCKKFDLPVLIAHGTEDKFTCPEASKRFFDKIQSVDKTYNSYSGFYHELHNEPEKDARKVIQTYIDWILERSSNQ